MIFTKLFFISEIFLLFHLSLTDNCVEAVKGKEKASNDGEPEPSRRPSQRLRLAQTGHFDATAAQRSSSSTIQEAATLQSFAHQSTILPHTPQLAPSSQVAQQSADPSVLMPSLSRNVSQHVAGASSQQTNQTAAIGQAPSELTSHPETELPIHVRGQPWSVAHWNAAIESYKRYKSIKKAANKSGIPIKTLSNNMHRLSTTPNTSNETGHAKYKPWPEATWNKAHEMFDNNKSNEEIEKETGIPVRTLRTRFIATDRVNAFSDTPVHVKNARWSDDTWNTAIEMYKDYKPISEIKRITKMPETTLRVRFSKIERPPRSEASSPQHVSPSSPRRSSPSVIRQSVNESAAQMLPTRSPGPQTPQTPALPMTDSQLQAYSALYDPIDEVSSLYMPSSSHRSQQTVAPSTHQIAPLPPSSHLTRPMQSPSASGVQPTEHSRRVDQYSHLEHGPHAASHFAGPSAQVHPLPPTMLPQTPATPSTQWTPSTLSNMIRNAIESINDDASSQLPPHTVIAPSTHQLAPLPPSSHLAQVLPPTQHQQSNVQPSGSSIRANPFGHLDLGETIYYAEQVSRRREQMRNERDQLIATMRSTIGTQWGEEQLHGQAEIARMRSTIGTHWSDELLHGQAELANLEQYSSHVQHLEQEIGSYDVMEQSLLARAQQLTQQGPSFHQTARSTYAYGQSSQPIYGMAPQLPPGQISQTLASNQVDPSQLYPLPNVLHGNYPADQTAGITAPSTSSEQWHNIYPSGQIHGNQPSLGQQSFNFQQPSNRASQHGIYHYQTADDASYQPAGAHQSTFRAPSTNMAPSAAGHQSVIRAPSQNVDPSEQIGGTLPPKRAG